jgi:hypothetical protein
MNTQEKWRKSILASNVVLNHRLGGIVTTNQQNSLAYGQQQSQATFV